MIKKIKNFFSSNTGLLIRIDDVAENMNWKLMKKSEALFEEYSIKPLVGVIPNNKDKDLLKFEKINNFWSIVRKWEKNGWEIAMHGYDHIYSSHSKNKDDYFNYGGSSEFYGLSLSEQKEKIKKGLAIFKKENISVRAFFAPNHIYDENTFDALKSFGIHQVIDGYGLFPYKKNDIIFTPQLFYKNILLPFGLQSTQIHLNFWNDDDFTIFEHFIKKNYKKIISYDNMLKKVNNTILSIASNYLTKIYLRSKRALV